MRGIWFCVILLGYNISVGAYAGDLYNALRRVYADNPLIVAQRAAVRTAGADVDRARTGYKPYLGLSAGVDAAHSEILGQKYDYVPTQIGAEFQQNIFQGFSTVAQIKAAKAMLASQQAILYSTEQDVFLDAINAYINILNARTVLDLNKNNQRVLQEYYDFVSGRESVGMLTKTDVAQAAARLDSARYGVIDAQTKYDNALETFRRIYGKTEDEYVDINLKRVANVFPDDIDEAQSIAMQSHPALIALEFQETAAREDITLARKTRLPSVDVRASLTQMDDLPILDRVRDGRVGVYLSVPLYDKGAAGANLERARFTVDGIGERIVNTRRVVVENLRSAWNVYESQSAAIEAAKSAVRANEMALDGIRDEQIHGRRTVLDVLNAEQELLNSRVALTRARHGRVSAYFAVLAAMGRLNADTLGLAREE